MSDQSATIRQIVARKRTFRPAIGRFSLDPSPGPRRNGRDLSGRTTFAQAPRGGKDIKTRVGQRSYLFAAFRDRSPGRRVAGSRQHRADLRGRARRPLPLHRPGVRPRARTSTTGLPVMVRRTWPMRFRSCGKWRPHWPKRRKWAWSTATSSPRTS